MRDSIWKLNFMSYSDPRHRAKLPSQPMQFIAGSRNTHTNFRNQCYLGTKWACRVPAHTGSIRWSSGSSVSTWLMLNTSHFPVVEEDVELWGRIWGLCRPTWKQRNEQWSRFLPQENRLWTNLQQRFAPLFLMPHLIWRECPVKLSK